MNWSYTICLIKGLWLLTNLLQAQSYSIGIAGVYGDDIQEPGFNLRAYYNLKNERICFGPEFTLFKNHIEEHGNGEIELSLFELNFNVHYIFEISEKFGVYPLTGLNFSREREEPSAVSEESVTEEKWGLNLGFGAHYPVRDFTFFVEYDHLFSDLNQNTYTAGVFYTFGRKERHED